MFTGMYTAIITPFRDGRIDEEALRRIIEEQIAAGVDGLVPCGTTGESATLTHEEHERVIKIVVELAKKRVKVIAGTGSNNTVEAVRLTKAAKRDGADGALLISPYYNKPTQEGLFRHYETVAREADFPIIMYNIPGRTAVTIAPETIVRLAKVPNVVGVKDATGSTDNASKVFAAMGENPAFSFLAGDDAMTLPLAAIGGKGVISAVANIAPAEMVAYAKAAVAGDLPKAREWHRKLVPLIDAAFLETNPIPVKTGMYLLGKCSAEMRLPLCEMSEGNKNKLRDAMRKAGLQVVA
jgi:4-hydroxy-tetrahydrodipicolinate synthase